MNESYFLRSERLGLRMLEEEDAEEYFIWFNDEEICQYNSHHRFPETLESEREYIRNVRQNPSTIVFAVIELASKKHIGNVALQSINYIDRKAEISNMFGRKEFWGKGYATEAYRLLIQYAFSTLNLHRIGAGLMEGGIGAQKTMEHLGFQEEGRRRDAIYKAGAYHDIIEYGILNGEAEPK